MSSGSSEKYRERAEQIEIHSGDGAYSLGKIYSLKVLRFNI